MLLNHPYRAYDVLEENNSGIEIGQKYQFYFDNSIIVEVFDIYGGNVYYMFQSFAPDWRARFNMNISSFKKNYKVYYEKRITMKTQKLYAVKRNQDKFYNFYCNSWVAATCTSDKLSIYLVEVKEDNENGTYWTWYNIEENSFQFTSPFKQAVEICFPYGFGIEEVKGKGKLMRVSVRQIRVALYEECQHPGIVADKEVIESE